MVRGRESYRSSEGEGVLRGRQVRSSKMCFIRVAPLAILIKQVLFCQISCASWGSDCRERGGEGRERSGETNNVF